jgi:putative zinc finger/helix-turn-helix YgiT family protein
MKNESVNRILCTNCERETEAERIVKKEIFVVRGETISLDIEYIKCKECGDEVLNPELSPDPFELAYKEYRHKHSLLQPEEISTWRKANHLNQNELAKLIGIGIATLNRYENGALQNESHEKLLRLVMDSSNLYKLIEKSEGVFTLEKKKQLRQKLLESGEMKNSFDDTIIFNLGSAEKNIFNGFRKLDLNKLYNLILYFTKNGEFKTKLNKLLFYTDFKHFKEYLVSVTGLKYAHLPYGPVPDNYEMYYASMLSAGLAEIKEDFNYNGYPVERFKAIKNPELNVFSPSELRIMASVMEIFKDYSAIRIEEISHEEAGYKQTKNSEIISYEYAKDLNY